MNKEWFVFKGTHHLGPFSVEEIKAFFHSGEINSNTQIWKEGNEKWLPISKIATFEFLFGAAESEELPPPLPVLPTHQSTSSLPRAPHVLISDTDDSELPPPIPLDAIIDPRGEVRLRIKSEEQNNRLSKYALIIGSIAFALIIAWYGLTQKEASIQLRIKGIMPVYLERLEMTATKNTPRFEVAMALSLDSLTLWGSTNLDGDISAVIKMNSIPNRALGLEDVALVVKGDFINHVAKFNKMVLIQGSKFLPGEYQIHAEGRQTHFINRHFKSLSAIPFFKSLNKSFSYDGTALIYPGTPREFEKRLFEHSSIILNEKLKPFQDKLERLMTFESILNTTSQNYLMELEKAKVGKSIQSFEVKFMREISPLLQSLVVRAHELANEPKYIEAENSRLTVAPYRVQVQLGKLIGEMASDMITKTEKFKKLTEKDKSALRTEFDNRARGIKLQIGMNIKILEEQIQKISNLK